MIEENNVSAEENDMASEEKNQNLEDECQCNNIDELDMLKKENEGLKLEIDSLKDKILRISAEYDNYRKRSTREKSELYSNSCVDIISEVLPILDNLERANSASADMD